MPVSTEVTKEQQKLGKPPEDYTMFSREAFDQKQIRFEFAQPRGIALDEEDIEVEDQTVADPRFLELPAGPQGAIDDFSNQGGMEEIVIDGDEWRTFVYGDGFTVHQDLDGQDDVARQRDYKMEMFQYLGDLHFMLGMDVGPSDEYQGMVDWLRSSIPSERSFDCEDYDGDSGDKDYSATPEDLLRGDAMKAVRGRVLDINGGWDLMIGSHDAIMNFAGYSAGETSDVERGPTFLERLEDSDVVQDTFRLPYKMQPDYLPRSARDELPEVFNFPLVDETTAVNPSGDEIIGNDEVFLIPDVERFSTEYVDLREMGQPEHYMDSTRGGNIAHDYKWRYGHRWDPVGEHPNATDVVHISNVSTLFGPNN